MPIKTINIKRVQGIEIKPTDKKKSGKVVDKNEIIYGDVIPGT